MHLLNPLFSIFLVVVIFWKPVNAQQLPWFTQYRAYTSIINPAALSPEFLEDKGFYNLVLNASFRREGGLNTGEVSVPETMILQANWMPRPQNASNTFRFLLGGHFMSDQFDLTHFNGGFIRFGVYTLNTPKLGTVSLGFNVGFNQFSIRSNPEDFIVPSNGIAGISSSYLNLGFGLFYSNQINRRHDLYFGFSVPQMRELDLTIRDQENDQFALQFEPTQFYGLVGANLYIADYAFLEPSFWIKSVFDNQIHVDFNLRYRFRKPFWIGVGVSTQETFHAEVGLHVRDMKKTANRWQKTRRPFLKIGLGYDYSFSSLPSYLQQALELNLGFIFPDKKY